ncbi:hypothetical protein PG985_014006 [Apiospora marii]|uniref:uncharacterized protein n=1 Tax=Apiospora marii TaxID=335849 RepID=UPI00312FBD20
MSLQLMPCKLCPRMLAKKLERAMANEMCLHLLVYNLYAAGEFEAFNHELCISVARLEAVGVGPVLELGADVVQQGFGSKVQIGRLPGAGVQWPLVRLRGYAPVPLGLGDRGHTSRAKLLILHLFRLSHLRLQYPDTRLDFIDFELNRKLFDLNLIQGLLEYQSLIDLVLLKEGFCGIALFMEMLVGGVFPLFVQLPYLIGMGFPLLLQGGNSGPQFMGKLSDAEREANLIGRGFAFDVCLDLRMICQVTVSALHEHRTRTNTTELPVYQGSASCFCLLPLLLDSVVDKVIRENQSSNVANEVPCELQGVLVLLRKLLIEHQCP